MEIPADFDNNLLHPKCQEILQTNQNSKDTLLYFIGSWSYLWSLRAVFWPVVLVTRWGLYVNTENKLSTLLDYL